MAFVITAFTEIAELIDNTTETVAAIGELSPTTRSYAREKQYFSDPLFPGYDVTVFWSRLNDVHQKTPLNVGLEIAKVSSVIRAYDYGDNFLAQYKADFPDHIDPQVGPIINFGQVYMPTWVSFKMQLTSEVADVKVWFVNARFAEEYPHREIVILPPTADIMSMYAPYADALVAIDAESIKTMTERMRAVVLKYPPSGVEPVTLKWVDPSEPSLKIMTDWVAVCYGRDATRYDSILEAIRDFLTTTTPHTLNEWRNYFPDIQFAKIFHMIPVWGRQAISMGGSTQDQYSPVIRTGEIVSIAAPFMGTAAESEIRAYGEFTSVLYKSLGMVIIGAGGNDIGQQWFSERYPDYTVTTFNDQNNRLISAATTAAIIKIETMVRLAEIDDGLMALPSTITRSTISGYTFLDSMEEGMIFRLVTKGSYFAALDKGAVLPNNL